MPSQAAMLTALEPILSTLESLRGEPPAATQRALEEVFPIQGSTLAHIR